MANNQLSTLNEIFNNKLFRIPDYQRGYAWGENQLEDFWDDILNIKDGGKHYTGLLTVEQVHKENIINNEQWQEDLWLLEQGYKAYYIIDGQQRLTTSIILLNVILGKFEDGEDINYTDKEKWQETFLYRMEDLELNERLVKRNLLTVLRSLKYGLKTIEHCLKMN